MPTNGGVVTRRDGLRLHERPDLASTTSDLIPRAVRVEVIDVSMDGAWYQVKWKGKQGWVWRDFIALDDVDPPIPVPIPVPPSSDSNFIMWCGVVICVLIILAVVWQFVG